MGETCSHILGLIFKICMHYEPRMEVHDAWADGSEKVGFIGFRKRTTYLDWIMFCALVLYKLVVLITTTLSNNY